MTHTKSLASSGRAGILALQTLRFSTGSAQKRGVLRDPFSPSSGGDPVAFQVLPCPPPSPDITESHKGPSPGAPRCSQAENRTLKLGPSALESETHGLFS